MFALNTLAELHTWLEQNQFQILARSSWMMGRMFNPPM
jgi:hypothetical protein